MKIFELINILNRSDILLNESMSLSELRRRIIKDEMRLDPDEEDWYQDKNNRNELIDTMSKVVGPSPDTELNHELKKFDTSKYTERGRIVKPKSLNNALELEILRVQNRNKNDKDSISEQYEKLNIKKDVEIYSVFTPQANIELSHKILKNNVEPTWCIASPTGAAQMWARYSLWDAEYPCVFIVIKHGIVNGVRNPKYEIKCNPEKSVPFANNECGIFEYIDEIRDAKQAERDFTNTSLFRVAGIDVQTLESAMRRLMNTDKAYSFSKKYGADFNKKLNALKDGKKLSSRERRQLLIMACKTEMMEQYWDYIDTEDMDFFIDRLIEYKTLDTRALYKYIQSPGLKHIEFKDKMVQKMINFFIKNKKCDMYVLSVCKGSNFPGANDLYDKVFYSIKSHAPTEFKIIPLEHVETYIKPEYILSYLDIPVTIMPEDIIHLINIGYVRNYNKFCDALKIYFKKDGQLTNLVKQLKNGEYFSYIKYVINIAHHLNKLQETDILYLYNNRNIPEIENAIKSLHLKAPDGSAISQRIIHMIEEDIKSVLPKIDRYGKSLKFLGSLLYAMLNDNIVKLSELPNLMDISMSHKNDNNINSRLKSYITTSYTQNGFNSRDLKRNFYVLEGFTVYNRVLHYLGNDTYYNEPIPGHSMTPYQFYRLTLYKKLYEMN